MVHHLGVFFKQTWSCSFARFDLTGPQWTCRNIVMPLLLKGSCSPQGFTMRFAKGRQCNLSIQCTLWSLCLPMQSSEVCFHLCLFQVSSPVRFLCMLKRVSVFSRLSSLVLFSCFSATGIHKRGISPQPSVQSLRSAVWEAGSGHVAAATAFIQKRGWRRWWYPLFSRLVARAFN